jgi:hypothetical protein
LAAHATIVLPPHTEVAVTPLAIIERKFCLEIIVLWWVCRDDDDGGDDEEEERPFLLLMLYPLQQHSC